MANIRIKDLSTTAAVTASDDFIAVDGTTNGTRKLNAYSPTFGGNLTVSGTGWNTFAGSIATTGANSLIQASTSVIDHSAGTFRAIGYGANTSTAAGFSFYGFSSDGSVGGARFSIDSSGNSTFSGNLTVSGGTISSGTATLTLKSTANTVVLQSAGTTALTLDASQNATFAGSIRSNQATNISLTSGVATTIFSLGTSAGVYIFTVTLDVNSNAGYAIVGKGAAGNWAILASAGSQMAFSFSANDLQLTNHSGTTSTTNTFNLLRLR